MDASSALLMAASASVYTTILLTCGLLAAAVIANLSTASSESVDVAFPVANTRSFFKGPWTRMYVALDECLLSFGDERLLPTQTVLGSLVFLVRSKWSLLS